MQQLSERQVETLKGFFERMANKDTIKHWLLHNDTLSYDEGKRVALILMQLGIIKE